jgi:hypothetical protein
MLSHLKIVKVAGYSGERADKEDADQTNPYGYRIVSCHFISPVKKFFPQMQKFAAR